MNCYLSRNYKGLSSAGNKAKTDIEAILQDMGFKNVGLPQTTCNGAVAHFLITLLGVLKTPFSLHRGDTLVLQYPLKKYYALVCRLAHWRGARVITIIHDLGSFRRKALTVEQEIRRLANSDYIIAHNDRMKQWLIDNGCRQKLGTLGIFDYLSDTVATPKAHPGTPYSVLYAGALNPRKNTFLYEVGGLITSYTINLYGNGFETDKAKGKEHFRYMGFVRSDDLIATARGDFGLVWDGQSVDGCTGDFGEYLKYNNPHKTSLYLRCCLPVVIWKQAALAQFVSDNGLGICIGSLSELDTILANTSEKQYNAMRDNVREMSKKLANGHFCRQSVTEALRQLD